MMCVDRLEKELERYDKEPEPDHEEPVELILQEEHSVALWCRCCGRIATLSGVYFTHFRVMKPGLPGYEVNSGG